MKRNKNKQSLLNYRLANHMKKGGKTSRKKQVARVRRFIKVCGCPAEQIGNKHVKMFYQKKSYSPTTERDYFYAIKLLWEFLDRHNEPPRPPKRNE